MSDKIKVVDAKMDIVKNAGKRFFSKESARLTKEEWQEEMTINDIPLVVYNDLEKKFYQNFEYYKLPGLPDEEVGFSKYVNWIILGVAVITLIRVMF